MSTDSPRPAARYSRPRTVTPGARRPALPVAAYDGRMAEDRPAWADMAGAVLLGLLAAGLLFVAVDVLSGGRLTGRKGCGCDDSEPVAGD